MRRKSTAKCFSRRVLKIYSTVDSGLQRLAESAVERGLARYDERRGEYAVSYHLDKGKWDNFMNAEERDIVLTPLSAGKVYNLLIAERVVDGYVVFSGKQKGLLTMKEFPFQRGDVVKGFYKGTDKKKTGFFVPVRTSDMRARLFVFECDRG